MESRSSRDSGMNLGEPALPRCRPCYGIRCVTARTPLYGILRPCVWAHSPSAAHEAEGCSNDSSEKVTSPTFGIALSMRTGMRHASSLR